MSKWIVGLRSALRSLVPVLTALSVALNDGAFNEVKSWTDLLRPSVLLAIVSALAAKGVFSGLTAKSVDVKVG